MAKQEYIEKNKVWLAAKTQEPGVKALDGGVCYRGGSTLIFEIELVGIA